MEYLVISLIFLLGLLDGAIFLCLFIKPYYRYEVLLFHTLLYLIINILSDKYLKKYSEVPKYLAFFMPGFGGIIVSIIYFGLNYFLRDSIVLDDYERYINFDRFLELNKKIDFEKEVETISFLDQMNLLDTQNKKQLIIDFGLNHSQGKLNLLHKGLLDQDGEVKHYSAVTINMLENEFYYLINQLREEFNLDKNVESLQKLAKVYKNYLDSNLISGEFLYIFNNEYIDILHKLSELKSESPEILNELTDSYIRNDELGRAEEINSIMIKTYPDRFEGILLQIRLAYEKKDFVKMNDLIMDLKKNNFKIPEKYETFLSFWIGKEEIL